MLVYQQINLIDFRPWSGAVNTMEELTREEMVILEETLEELYPDGLSETELNDILWFEDEWISEIIGRNLFE